MAADVNAFLWQNTNVHWNHCAVFCPLSYDCLWGVFILGSSFNDFNCVDVVMGQCKPSRSLATHFALHSWSCLSWTASRILACCRLTNRLLLTEQTPSLSYMLEICTTTQCPYYDRHNNQKKMQWMKTEYAGHENVYSTFSNRSCLSVYVQNNETHWSTDPRVVTLLTGRCLSTMTDVIGGATTMALALPMRVGSVDRAVTFVEMTLALNAVDLGFAESWKMRQSTNELISVDKHNIQRADPLCLIMQC